MTMEQLCQHLMRLIHAPIRVYDQDGQRIAVYQDNGEQQDIFERDQEFLQVLLSKRSIHYPVLHVETEQIIYGIVSTSQSTYLCGPCCLGRNVGISQRYLVKKHGLDEKIPYRLFRISFEDFTEMLIMMFEMATGQTIDQSQVWIKSFTNREFNQAVQEKIHKVFYDIQENSTVHNPYSQELREQESIRTGNQEALERSFQEKYFGKLGTLSPDSLRNMKDLSIVLITLASRSAIAGGVLPEIAYSMSDAYIQKVEELRNEGEVLALGRQAEMDYCRMVRESAASPRQNPIVSKCKELVLQNLHWKISVKELAEQLEVNPNYLSQLFGKEEGISLTDYIAREKINFAKQQLIYTDDPYERVAYSYGFFSQSHFGRVFKKWTNMTPKQYREKYGWQGEELRKGKEP